MKTKLFSLFMVATCYMMPMNAATLNFAGIQANNINVNDAGAVSTCTIGSTDCPSVNYTSTVGDLMEVSFSSMFGFGIKYQNGSANKDGHKDNILKCHKDYLQVDGKNGVLVFSDLSISEEVVINVVAKGDTPATFTVEGGVADASNPASVDKSETKKLKFTAMASTMTIKETTGGFRIMRAIVGGTNCDFQKDGIAYYIFYGDSTIAVTHKISNYTGSVVIPASVTHNGKTYSVTTIGNDAFYNCNRLTSVTIPNSVTTIGNYAFESCRGLTSITIPNSVTMIGNKAFYYCSGLTKTNYTGTIADWCKIKFGDSYANPMYYSHNFYINDVEVKDLVIPEGVDTIGDYTFSGCSGLTSVTIGKSVTTIGESAFEDCSGLTSVTINSNAICSRSYTSSSNFKTIFGSQVQEYIIGDSVTKIGNYAFYKCSGLISVIIPNSVTTIGMYAFDECTGLTSITIPNSVTKIGHYAFYKCSGLISVIIPNSVTTIGDYAFAYCSGLTSVTIPNSVTTIGKGAFEYCSGLTSVTINSNALCGKDYTSSSNFKTIFGSQVKEYIIGDSVTTIGVYAFYGCSGLTSITIPISVTTIGSSAFEGCSSLTSVTIPNSVTTIGDNAFSSCSGLTSVTIGNSVTTIGDNAFSSCSGLTSVTIPSSVTTIGDGAFDYCSGLTKTNYTGTIANWCKIKFDYSSANPIYYSHNFYINDVEVKDLVIPQGVDTIGDYAFSSCSGLTSVTIGNSVTTIGNYAFYGCSGLTSITIPSSVTKIGYCAFESCSGLTSVIIGNSVTTIGYCAFESCSGLTSITIPSSVTKIGYDAFQGCSGLKKTNYIGTIADWCKIKFGNYSSNPMYYSHNLYINNDVEVKELVIPQGVDTIGDYTFSGCSGLTSVTIPNSVTMIGEGAFSYCRGLTSVTIPNSVTTIGYCAFESCSGLTSITCYAITPPTCGSYCFYNVSNSILVYVPAHSVNAYKNAYGWKSFTNLQANPDDLAVVTCNVIGYGTQTGADTYIKGDTCTLTITPDAGYQFTQWNDGDTDNPRSFVVTQDTIFTAQIDTTKSGQCGENLYWELVGNTLIISGAGAMYDYTETQPVEWCLSLGKISKLILEDGITHIGDLAFANLSNKNLKEIALPNSVETIGKYAFAECSYLKTITLGAKLEDIDEYAFQNDQRLLYVNCYAEEPPILQENAFENYDIYLQVPCDVLDEYKVAKGWKLFNKENVSCLSAEEKPIEGDQVVVTPSTDNATFTWPVNPSADGYSLEITKDGVVFCTLKFNAQGQLTGIAFAPSRDGAREMVAAEMTTSGWQFTVTGLNQASKYGYTLDATNASQQSIKHYEGEFTTTGGMPTDVEQLTIDNAQCTVRKFIRHNQLQIMRNGKMYNALGF
ncbi:MAG: leucine-rich repeat protein [Paludibacteraceae bacterium]|nr:leucine-rich repeat protein [Paludibacteraceae bacterium]